CGSPKPVAQRQNIFVRVFRWTWTSRPMTGSQLTSAGACQADAGHAVAGIGARSSPEPLRDGIKADRSLERMAGAKQRVLRELCPDQLQPNRQPCRQAARNREARQAGDV